MHIPAFCAALVALTLTLAMTVALTLTLTLTLTLNPPLTRHVHIPAFCAALEARGVHVARVASEHGGDYRQMSLAPPGDLLEIRFHHPPSPGAAPALSLTPYP